MSSVEEIKCFSETKTDLHPANSRNEEIINCDIENSITTISQSFEESVNEDEETEPVSEDDIIIENSELIEENQNEEIVLSSEDESEATDIPNGAECLIRCKEFARITGTDTALAMFYLQDTKWDLQKGINAYLETAPEPDQKVVACFDIDKLNKEEKRKSEELKTNSKKQKSTFETDSSDEILIDDKAGLKSQKNDHFKVLSWNIDGIDNLSLELRAMGVAQKILSEKPDIVLLQEIVHENEQILRSKLNQIYDFYSGDVRENKSLADTKNYYTMILSKKSSCKFLTKNLINFENSLMGRNLLKVKLNFEGKVDICVMTSHLESTAEFAKQRTNQLKEAFKEMLDENEQTLVIFGGDLNLRNTELSAIGGLPNGIYDLWESTGSRKECNYTWDTTRNTNLKWQGKFKPRCRFDRLYFRSDKRMNPDNVDYYTLMPAYFELEGLEKLKSCGRFCSDHWAIQSYFDLKLIKAK